MSQDNILPEPLWYNKKLRLKKECFLQILL